MSAAPHHDDHEPNPEGPVRTPKQLAIAVLAAFIVPIATIVLLATYVTTDSKPAAGSTGLEAKAVEQRIAPVARVTVKDLSDPAALKSGAEAWKGQCAACHAAGLAGAPKFGDATAWAPRIKTGYEALLTSALKGKGVMGAQGGGDLSELEVARAVVYMANAAGAGFEEPTAPAAAAAATEAAPAPAAPAPVAAPAAVAAPAPAVAVVAAAAPAATAAVPALYGQICAACHAQGVAGAPKFGDKAAWSARVGQGVDALTQHVVTGKGAMPPKGGAATASEADIKAVVVYMVGAVK